MSPYPIAPHAPAAEHDMSWSSSTLVPQEPFFASFDPNAPTPTTTSSAAPPPLPPASEAQLRLPRAADAHALWAHRLSVSFGTIAEQIAAASQALARVPGTDVNVGVAAFATRLENIETAQEKLGEQIHAVQNRLARLQVDGEKLERDAVVEVQEESAGEFKSATEIALEELQKRVDGAIETIKLDQARLYARLHNATVTVNKMSIKAPMMANGKIPQNFPNTKGEFEHLTKERYEHLLRSYDLAIKGDTNAKREALREFIGLTPPS